MTPAGFRKAGIRARLVVLVAVLLGLIAVVVLAYLPAASRAASLRALATETDAIARMTAYSVAPALLFGDRRAAEEVLRGADHAGRAAYVVVVDERGEVFAASDLEAARAAGFVAATAPPDGQAGYYRTTVPVERDGVTIGTVHAGADLAPVEAESAAVARAVAAPGAVVILVGLAIAWGIGTLVTEPLHQMVRTAREIGAGNLAVRAPVGSGGEAGELADSFNEMLDHLQMAQAQLEALNVALERRVAERTRELADEVEVRRQSEQALRRANDRFALAAAAVDGAIYDYDVPSGRIEWTDGITRVFGYAEGEVGGTHDWREERIHPEDQAETLSKMRKAITGASDFAAEYRFRSRNGEFLHVLDRGRVVITDGGRTLRIVGLMEDVTPMRRLEEQYHHAQRMEAVGRLAGGVAHDFNNLLTAILGYSDIALSSLSPEGPERSYVEEIQKAGTRAANLTQQLLAFSRKQMVRPTVLDLNALVGDLRSMIERLVGEGVRLEGDLAAGPLCIRGDYGQIEQVVLNVVVNARDAMPEGGEVRVSTRGVEIGRTGPWAELGAEPGRYVLLEVRDTGCGMDEATRARVFEPFFTTKAVGAGTGLGMATVYAIVSQNGGWIRIDSAPDEGTTVAVLLPRTEEAELGEAPVRPDEGVAGGSETLLVVEDEEAVRSLVARTLESEGYRVLLAECGAEAMELAAAERRIDLVVTDVVMPGMGGREVVERLRRQSPRLPALFVSGYTDDTVLHHGVYTDGDQFLGKPFTRSDLLGKVRQLLDRTAPLAPGRSAAPAPEEQPVL